MIWNQKEFKYQGSYLSYITRSSVIDSLGLVQELSYSLGIKPLFIYSPPFLVDKPHPEAMASWLQDHCDTSRYYMHAPSRKQKLSMLNKLTPQISTCLSLH